MRDATLPRFAVAMLLSLAGCTMGPDFHPPVAALPPVWAGLPAATTAQAPDWWRAFGDPTLDALEARAMAANLDLAAARERLAAARIARGAVAAAGQPTLTGTAGYSRDRIGTQGAAALAAPILGLPPQTGTPARGVDFDLYSLGVGARWEIDLWGRQRRETEAAGAEVAAGAAATDGVALAVAAEVARTYFQLRGLHAEQRFAASALALADRALAIARMLHARGLRSALEVAQDEEDRARLIADRVELDRRTAALARALAVLVGGDPDHAVIAPAATLPAFAIGPTPARLPSETARRRPDIVEAEARLHAATARIGVAQADFYPRIDLTGLFSFDVLRLADLGWDARNTSVGPALTLPIFAGGRLQRQLDLRRSEERAAALAYRATVLAAWREIDDAVADVRAAAAQATAAAADLARRRAVETMATARFARGDIAAAAVIDAQTHRIEAEAALMRRRLAAALAQVQLHRALGG